MVSYHLDALGEGAMFAGGFAESGRQEMPCIVCQHVTFRASSCVTKMSSAPGGVWRNSLSTLMLGFCGLLQAAVKMQLTATIHSATVFIRRLLFVSGYFNRVTAFFNGCQSLRPSCDSFSPVKIYIRNILGDRCRLVLREGLIHPRRRFSSNLFREKKFQIAVRDLRQ